MQDKESTAGPLQGMASRNPLHDDLIILVLQFLKEDKFNESFRKYVASSLHSLLKAYGDSGWGRRHVCSLTGSTSAT